MNLKYFSKDSLQKIEAAIRSAESKTSGEIVCQILPYSSPYNSSWLVLFLGGEVFGAVAYCAGSYLAWTPPEVLPFAEAMLAGGLLLVLLGKVSRLRFWLVGKANRNRACEDKAFVAFSKLHIRETAGATGILVFISEWEHRVVILADSKIHSKVGGNGFWKQEADLICQGFKNRQPVPAICQAIADMGQKLAEHFPKSAEDRNELPDSVQT